MVNLTRRFLPEGRLLNTEENRALCGSLETLRQAREQEKILEGTALLCDEEHNLIVRLGSFTGIVPRAETAVGISEGTTRDIAILSKVGKSIAFTITDIQEVDGIPRLILSRRRAQELALAHIFDHWSPGLVVPATVTHLEPFGAFVDIGCGVPSMIGVERLSVSRIAHTADRLQMGQDIFAAVLGLDWAQQRILLSHRELLGTWEENAALFRPGMTVPGYVRSIKDYGAFIELTPNLSGLAECRPGLREGGRVSVYIKSIQPERMKIKLLIIDLLPDEDVPEPPRYFIDHGRLTHWRYAPEGCYKSGGETVFL